MLVESTCTLQDCFSKMRLFAAMQKQHRNLRSRARKRKKEQALSVLQRAEAAARKGDAKELYSCVRFLAKGGKLRLRDADGQLVGHGAECGVLAEYAAELFKGSSERLDFRHSSTGVVFA